MIATASTTYSEPFNLARQFASLDHISNGRVGWNIVTSWLASAAGNFGDKGQVSHADRYTRGEEFMAVVKALWDSWAEDAVIDDRRGGRYARADRIRRVNHKGQYYQVAGPLNMPRCPQGRPVLVSGGIVRHRPTLRRAPRRGCLHRPYGEEHGAGILCRPERRSLATEGRSLTRCSFYLGSAPSSAPPKPKHSGSRGLLNELSGPEVGRTRLSGRFGGHDFSHLKLDER